MSKIGISWGYRVEDSLVEDSLVHGRRNGDVAGDLAGSRAVSYHQLRGDRVSNFDTLNLY